MNGMSDLEKAIYETPYFKDHPQRRIDSVLFAIGGMTVKDAVGFLNAMAATLTEKTLKRIVVDENW